MIVRRMVTTYVLLFLATGLSFSGRALAGDLRSLSNDRLRSMIKTYHEKNGTGINNLDAAITVTSAEVLELGKIQKTPTGHETLPCADACK